MVSVEEVPDDAPPAQDKEEKAADVDVVLPSQDRLLDAESIEEVAKSMKRVSARMHLEALAKKLRKESEALKRVEKSKAAADMVSKENESDNNNAAEEKTTETAAAAPAPKKTAPAKTATAAAGIPSPTAKFTPVDRFAFDAGGYNAAFVTVYVNLPGVGSIPRNQVTCDFTKHSFDLIVRDLQGKSHRLFKEDLEHDIDEKTSKIVVKADKVIVKLAKTKKEYGGYDYWTKLTDPKKSKKGDGDKANPQDSIMKMMKDMYDQGDDNMKKMIGETMMKQQRGELNKDMGSMDGMGGGLGGMGDLGGAGLGDDDEDDDDETF